MKVMIDPGHGGTDIGASANNVKEKDMNLEVALILKELLRKYNIDAQLTRHQDATLSLKKRVDISNFFKADLFISIHHNAANGKAKGYEIYHFENSKNGKKLAELIDKEFSKLSTKRYVGDKEMAGSVSNWNYYVLENTNAPAVLTEFCFIDNLDDLKLYHPQKQADAIANAVLEFFGIEKNVEIENDHWAEKIFEELTKNFGVIIHEKRFDDNITRAEAMSLLLEGLKSIKNYIDSH